MADLEALLVQTSRTFALAIPELPDPTRREVTIAYLLYRIADTFEDATRWTAERQVRALGDLDLLLDGASLAEAGRLADDWTREPPLDHEGYVRLLAETPAVLEAFRSLRPTAQTIIRRHVHRTTAGMARYAGRAGDLHLADVEELRDYCHVVAGIVGEMLTELFVLGRPALASVAGFLGERARCFGEGLQLVNILKDAAGDMAEGRSFLPPHVPRARILALARDDLRRAEEYVRALEEAGAEAGIIAFNALPVLLAWETLGRVERDGAGAKLSRPEVAALHRRVHEAIAHGEPSLAGALPRVPR